MMRNLLKERFRLEYHWDKKKLDVYELIIAKGGHRLVEAEIPSELPTLPEGPLRRPKDHQGYPIVAPGWPVGVGSSANSNMYVSLKALDEFILFEPSGIRRDLGLLRFTFRMVAKRPALVLQTTPCTGGLDLRDFSFAAQN
jgi:hypothetical protein